MLLKDRGQKLPIFFGMFGHIVSKSAIFFDCRILVKYIHIKESEENLMMPIVRTECIRNPFSGRTFVGNIVLDKLGRECTWIADGYYLLNKNGKVGKRKTNAWN